MLPQLWKRLTLLQQERKVMPQPRLNPQEDINTIWLPMKDTSHTPPLTTLQPRLHATLPHTNHMRLREVALELLREEPHNIDQLTGERTVATAAGRILMFLTNQQLMKSHLSPTLSSHQTLSTTPTRTAMPTLSTVVTVEPREDLQVLTTTRESTSKLTAMD